MNQNQFTVYWKASHTNIGDYHSKHHPPGHHQRMRQIIFNSAYLLEENAILQGYDNTLRTHI